MISLICFAILAGHWGVECASNARPQWYLWTGCVVIWLGWVFLEFLFHVWGLPRWL